MRIAAGQMIATTLAEAPGVWPMVDRLAGQAAAAGADVFLLPETTYPAYWLDSYQRYMQADIERTDRVLERLAATARANRFWLIGGFVEEKGGRLFNSAAVFDRQGKLVHTARKSFLWDCDNRWFSPAETIAAFDSEFGRLGVLICADCRAPEITATLVADGARMILMPTAWVNAAVNAGDRAAINDTGDSHGRDGHVEDPPGRATRGAFESNQRGREPVYKNVHPEFLVRARAIEFGVPFACCSKAGLEGDKLAYVGQSRIVDHDGKLLAAAPPDGEHLIVADVEPHEGRVAEISEDVRRRLCDVAPYRSTAAANATGGRLTFRPTANFDEIAGLCREKGVRHTIVTAAEVQTFARPRLAALEGAQVLLVRGRVSEESLARARSAENRVFVIVAADRPQMVVAPDGSLLWQEGKNAESVELDLSQADVKRFTPETDLWDQRRVASYQFLTAGRSAATSAAPAGVAR